jgi:hypothetical protein
MAATRHQGRGEQEERRKEHSKQSFEERGRGEKEDRRRGERREERGERRGERRRGEEEKRRRGKEEKRREENGGRSSPQSRQEGAASLASTRVCSPVSLRRRALKRIDVLLVVRYEHLMSPDGLAAAFILVAEAEGIHPRPLVRALTFGAHLDTGSAISHAVSSRIA